MSYRTTRAFERVPTCPPPLSYAVCVFGGPFKRMVDYRVVNGIVALAELFYRRG